MLSLASHFTPLWMFFDLSLIKSYISGLPYLLPTLFNTMTASWSLPVMLNVSPSSPSRMVYSSMAFSPRSASVAERRPTSTPGAASSEIENDQAPSERERTRVRERARERETNRQTEGVGERGRGKGKRETRF